MASYELAAAIAPRIATCGHGETGEITADVFAELARRSITTLGLRAQRQHDDVVEIPSQRAHQLVRRRAPGTRDDGGCRRILERARRLDARRFGHTRGHEPLEIEQRS